MRGFMKLTLLNRLKLCLEILTTQSGHKHTAVEKQLSTFKHGYEDGFKDCSLEIQAIKRTDKPAL